MSIFDRAETRATDRFVPFTIGRPSLELVCEKTGNVRAYTPDRNEEWELRLRLSQRFWANRQQRGDLEMIALRAVAAELYADVLRELPHLRLCIESGDRDGAREAFARIEKAPQP